MSQPSLITVKDVAAMLSISRTSVWRYVNKGRLPEPIRIEGAVRWRRADIEALFATAQ
jgi:predicted DNA-binding transcriptional regulator AlpA